MELMLKHHYMEMQCIKQQLNDLQEVNAKLQTQIEALTLDVAFYGGNMINLSCNNK
jgi:DNA-binding protein YbaB